MQYLTDFVATLNVGDAEKRRYTKDITAFLESGQSLADFISALSATRKNAKTIDATKKRIERYLLWVEDKERSKNLPMEFENEQEQITTPVENEHIQEVTTSEVEKSNAGRKRLDENGEKRDIKFMIYFTPSLLADFKRLCSLKEISCTNLIYELVQQEVERNREALNFFDECKKRLK